VSGVAAIILAAGASRRMGSSKPMLPWDGTTLIDWELRQLLDSSAEEVVIVIGSRSEVIRRSLGEAARYTVFNQRWPQGRATSLAAGARSLIERGVRPDAIVVQNVDQPTRADIVDRLVSELRATGAEIVQPSYRGKAGHPVVLAGSLLEELAAVQEETLGMRAVVDAHPPRIVEMDDPVVRLDLDTPDLLDEARQVLRIRS
jgi:molybdenum cofactor cytidylyltransferase